MKEKCLLCPNLGTCPILVHSRDVLEWSDSRKYICGARYNKRELWNEVVNMEKVFTCDEGSKSV
jgi:hypothetical protein